MKIALGVIALFVVIILIIYGTLSPCGILKKVIANEAAKNGGAGLYMLFGGFVERGIDALIPIRCLTGLYKIKTEGADAGFNYLFKGGDQIVL